MNVLLIEDDVKIASFVTKGLNEAGYVVDHYINGTDGLAAAKQEIHDAGVIDIMLPGIDGLSIIDELRGSNINLPVLILSAKRSVDDRVKGFDTGGDDYLTKPFAFSELLARLQALIRRANHIVEPNNITVHDLSIDIRTRKVKRGGKKIVLQPREFSLLEYLMRNSERIVSKSMIMEHVWDYNFDPHTNVVEARVCRLREKIDKDFEFPLIHTIRGVGYVLKHDS
ncbi:MAG: DNA-binding response regulator [SAR86 cluster bacterium]|uniref:DNA-binding response regulator n=1 Tax=SAR86 cluster bacterium TaxID=2030880 RepID=A0A2A4WWQ6_9GAMM|nr:MAG: DNA-binding response regulator [SAR86 cluster bacterium]